MWVFIILSEKINADISKYVITIANPYDVPIMIILINILDFEQMKESIVFPKIFFF